MAAPSGLDATVVLRTRRGWPLDGADNRADAAEATRAMRPPGGRRHWPVTSPQSPPGTVRAGGKMFVRFQPLRESRNARTRRETNRGDRVVKELESGG